MSIQTQQNWNHNFAHTKLKLCHFQDRNHLKSSYLATFYSPRKIQETMHLIFLSNTTLNEESNKIWFAKIGHLQVNL